MTKEKQEKVAAGLLSTMMYVWCERDDTEHVEFNCEICEFHRDDGRCLAKMFVNKHKSPKIDMPQGVIAEPCVEGVKG